MLTMYLAGAIRDGRSDDVNWREQMSNALFPLMQNNILRIISPLGGKVYSEKDRMWTISGIQSSAHLIVSQDFWSVDRCDIGVFNMLSIAEKYPTIGTLMEYGRSTARSMLRYVIWPKGETGHTHSDRMYQVHPFIVNNATHVFESVEDCIVFLMQHIPVLAGVAPWFDPQKPDQNQSLDEYLKHLPTTMKVQA